MKMLSSFVGWILSVSSSSSSSSEDEDIESDNNVSAERDNDGIPVAIPAAAVTLAIPAATTTVRGRRIPTRAVKDMANSKRKRIDNDDDDNNDNDLTIEEEKKVRQFPRIWTKEDEIKLLQGFLDYTMQNDTTRYKDTALFFDRIKTKFQAEYNKNQLVEKLRRLKRKYRNALYRINSCKDFAFRNPHDKTTYEISRKIWGESLGQVGVEDNTLDTADEASSNPSIFSLVNVKVENEEVVGRPRPAWRRTSARLGLRNNKKLVLNDGSVSNNDNYRNSNNIDNVGGLNIEETVKSYESPLFKELSNFNSGSGEVMDEKLREERISELEVHSKRLKVVQDQIKGALEELKSTRG